MKQAQISTLLPGTMIHYRERAAVVLEHTGGGVFVQLLDSIGDHRFGDTNDWRTSTIRKLLNERFVKDLTEGNVEEIMDTVTDLTAMDGTTDYGYSIDKLTLLTVDQCRKYRYIRPILEGDWEWTSTADSTNNTTHAWGLSTNGTLIDSGCSGTYGVRPAFTLPSTLTVKVVSNNNLAVYTDADLLTELLKRQRNE